MFVCRTFSREIQTPQHNLLAEREINQFNILSNYISAFLCEMIVLLNVPQSTVYFTETPDDSTHQPCSVCLVKRNRMSKFCSGLRSYRKLMSHPSETPFTVLENYITPHSSLPRNLHSSQ